MVSHDEEEDFHGVDGLIIKVAMVVIVVTKNGCSGEVYGDDFG